MNTTTTITNNASGEITRITIIHHDYFNYRWLILAILASAFLAWVLRKIFWGKDSN
jgi:hypothetical protein